MDVERPVTFPSNGKRIFGILHESQGPPRDVGVLFLNAGPHNRVGPHRIYVKTARRLARLGFPCLRIDFPGVGDSEGELRSIYFDCHDAADAAGALDFLGRELGLQQVALVGICAGARSGLRLAAGDRRVSGLVAWGLPIISVPPNLPVQETGAAAGVSERAATQMLGRWLRKSISPSAWRDYLKSGQSPLQALTRFGRIAGRLLARLLGRRVQTELDFFSAIGAYLESGRAALFAYGENDSIPRDEFEHRFPEIAGGRSPSCDYAVIANGDHTFTSVASEGAVIERTLRWFDERYPTSRRAAIP